MLTPSSTESLKGINKWGKFVGYFLIVSSAISAFFGLFMFLVGAIPGILGIFYGLFIVKSAKNAEKLITGYDENEMNSLLEHYKKQLKFLGIYLIVYLAFFIVMAFIYGAMIATMIAGGGYY